MNSNNKYILFLFCFLFFTGKIQCQNKKTDSLKRALTVHKQKDTVRVNLLNILADLSLKKDLKNTITYIEESEFISDSIGFKRGKAKILYIKGTIESLKLNYNQAIECFSEALLLYEIVDFKAGISDSHSRVGLAYYHKNDYNNAIKHYKKAITIYENIGNIKSTAVCLKRIGKAYKELGDYESGIVYYNKALGLNTRHNYELEISSCYKNIGSIYLSQANYPVALEYYNKSLDVSERIKDSIGISKVLNNIGIIYKNYENYDKAIENYKKSLRIQKKVGNKRNISKALSNLGSTYTRKKGYNIALSYYKEALNISKEINDKHGSARYLNNIGKVYMRLFDNTLARKYFEEAKNIGLEIRNKVSLCYSYGLIATSYVNEKKYNNALINAIKSNKIANKLGLLYFQRDNQELLSEIYKNIGNYKKAFISHEKFKTFNDSLFNKENIQKITQLEYEYKYKQKLDSASIRELKLTKTVTTTNKNLEKSQRNYLWAIIGILLVSILLGSIIFFLKLRNVKSKAKNIVTEQRLLRSQMTPHFIFNSLSVLQGMILNKEEKKAVSYLSKFSKLLRITLENSRDKTVSLCQELIAVEHYLELQNLEETTPYEYAVLVDNSIKDQSSFKIPPMLIQPFIENAVEHAFITQEDNRKIDIHLTFSNKKLICTITDNGIGIHVYKEKKTQHKKSLATTITSERLKILSKDFKINGSIIIEDRQVYNEQGTIVILEIPYKIDLT